MAILDRYAEAGGTFVDTANNYAFWVNGTQGGESEELLGRAGGEQPLGLAGRARPHPRRGRRPARL
ncbi:hypothetical protein Airi02_009970 [Actinoallomurus iriomotensis]|uniref:NADP-dependent oxidoreductase domain-containing protein n=2 Tax=Actinoallomurus iriomotensis TaxID=478107 RepID=A0A9W6RZM9_9ACTN|nr:hypothetical protein Airi02_009970 [Actinoallomurus iriomotensis]